MDNININGAKNSALPIIAGTLLFKKKYKLYNIPFISDINIQLNLLKQYNVDIKIEKDFILIDTTNMIIPSKIYYDSNTRGTYYFIGSTIYNDVDLEYILANGCDIDNNNRKIDIHLELISMFGKEYEYINDILKVYGLKNIKNFNYKFKIPSVGATINGLLIFSKTNNIITFENYAKDPYIFDVINFLVKNGINITFDENKIIIDGINNSINCSINNDIIFHTIIPDPIEAISYIIYSGINLEENTISCYTIGPIIIEDLGKCKNELEIIGIELINKNDNYYYIKKNKLKSFNITTGYFPEIYTDTQPFFCILGLHINEISFIKETVWNNRFKYINQLNKFGYNLKQNNNILEINNNCSLIEKIDTNIILTDLRAGMALYMFIYKEKNKYNIINKYYIERGYMNYEDKLTIPTNNIYCNYNTSILSNINIGGFTKYYYEAYTLKDFYKIIEFSKNMKYKIIGDGNNIYFSNYYNGIIIKNKYIEIYEDNDYINVSSGYLLMDLVKYCANINMDISNIAGIPGTIGGAVFGNAGAYGLEMKDIIDSCIVIRNNKLINLNNNELEFNYRTSIFKKNDYIIISIKIKKTISELDINHKINNILLIRNDKFVYSNNLGSIFKNPIINNNKIYAWELLDKLKLRNNIIYNLKFSETNPNIIINISNASTDDMNNLLNYIEETILKKFNIKIEKEIIYIN